MLFKVRVATVVAYLFLIFQSVSASAADEGVFVGVDAGAAFRFGSTSVTNAGAANIGRMYDVDFDTAFSVGGVVGYQFASPLSIFLLYNHVEGDVRWLADFGGLGSSEFNGTAQSDVFLANLGYGHRITDRLSLQASIGAGLAINQLSTIEEGAVGGATFAYVKGATKTGLAGRAGLGLAYSATDAFSFSLSATADYVGGFESGRTRNFIGTGVQTIGRYKIDDTWNTGISGRVSWKF